MRQQLRTYCTESSFAPLAQVSKARSTTKKISWAIISLAMTGYMGFYCTTLLIKFFNYPIKFSIELEFSSEQEFPSITFCNLNPVKKAAIRGTEYEQRFAKFPLNGQSETSYIRLQNDYLRYVKDWDLANSTPLPPTTAAPAPLPWTPNDLISQVNGSTYTTPEGYEQPRLRRRAKRETSESEPEPSPSVPLDLDNFMENISYSRWDDDSTTDTPGFFSNQSNSKLAFSELLTAFDPADRKKYAHKIKDMLLSCEWRGYPCAPSNFSHIDNHKYGQCYTFNPAKLHGHKTTSMRATSTGPLNGLVMELYIEQSEYIPVLSPQAGLRVLIHTRGQMPFPEAEGFTISPGFATIVGITRTSVTRLPAPYGVCVDHGDSTTNTLYGIRYGVTYSKEACLKSCLQETIIATCRCAYSRYAVPNKSRVCQINNDTVAACISQVEQQVRSGELNCHDRCPNSCNDESYDLTISTSRWPSENYKEDLRRRVRTLNSKMIKVSQPSAGANGADSLPVNILKLEVYFQELNYKKITQQPAYEIESLISDMGGQLGLWLGVSLLAVGELLELLLTMFSMLCCKSKQVNQNPEVKKPDAQQLVKF